MKTKIKYVVLAGLIQVFSLHTFAACVAAMTDFKSLNLYKLDLDELIKKQKKLYLGSTVDIASGTPLVYPKDLPAGLGVQIHFDSNSNRFHLQFVIDSLVGLHRLEPAYDLKYKKSNGNTEVYSGVLTSNREMKAEVELTKYVLNRQLYYHLKITQNTPTDRGSVKDVMNYYLLVLDDKP